ncbi:MAG: hypothetical protein E6G41_06525 [Actinobacteria bacterium]|nr:MAG: hypothetical protein E6G41_06525 [Actinomycetota bacterium]
MRSKITVIGDVLLTNRHAEIVRWPSPDSGGADVVVIADGNALAEAAEFVARRAPAAVVVATDPAWCEELLQRTQLPRGRVVSADDVGAAVDAILDGSGAELDVTVRHDGEHGREGFHRVRARLGAAGVLAI